MPKVESAKLVPSASVSQFVIGQLLDGIKINVVIDGQEREGVVCNLDFAPGASGHVFAKVHVPIPGPGSNDGYMVRVAIKRDGNVLVLPEQGQ